MDRYRLIEKVSSNGDTYREAEDLMAIPNVFLNLIVYIFPSKDAAESGVNLGATGFISAVESDDGNTYLYAVTNAHVLHTLRKKQATQPALRFNTREGGTTTIEAPLDKWHEHPDGDDLAIYPLEPSAAWKFSYISEDSFIREDMLHGQLSMAEVPGTAVVREEAPGHKWVEMTEVGVGDETITIGRFLKHSGTEHNLAAARYGHISMLPYEPVKQSKAARGFEFEQYSYLVETHSVNGFSGSPVLMQTPLRYREKTATSNGTRYKEQVFLLGIDWGHFDFNGEIIDPQSREIKVPCGMMCVVPAWKLIELLHVEELEVQRKELDKEIKKKSKDTATADSEISKEEFEAIMQKVTRKVQPKKKGNI
jgi:hypothetical protein